MKNNQNQITEAEIYWRYFIDSSKKRGLKGFTEDYIRWL